MALLYAMVLERVQWMAEEKDRKKAMDVLEWSDSDSTLRAQDAAARAAAEALGVSFSGSDWERAWEARTAQLAAQGLNPDGTPIDGEGDSTVEA